LTVDRSADLEAGGRPAANRLLERLARDLVQRRLLPLAERVDGADVEGDRHRVLADARLAESIEGSGEAVIAQDDRLEVEGEVAQLADGGARPQECAVDDALSLLEVALLDQPERRVEHER